MIDVHSHMHDERFDVDRAEVLARAQQAGVQLVLTLGEGHADNLRALAICRDHPMLRPCFGLHPDAVAREQLAPVLEQIRAHADQITAVGEVGLDYWLARDDQARERQQHALEQLVALALELDLPLSLHSRDAGHYTIDLLERCHARRVCLHAFNGAAKHAVRAAELGYLLSIPPSALRSPQKQKMVRRLPLEAMLLETDSPELGPERGARNEPANARLAAQLVAEIKEVTVEQVLRVTTDGARRLFRL